MQVRLEPAIEVVADGDLALLAALFPEPQDALGALVLEVAAAQPGEGADAGPGVGQHAQHGPIPQSHDVGEVDGGEQVPGLLDGELWGVLPSTTACFRPRTEENGFRATAWRVTKASKKCRSAARARFRVGSDPGISSMKRPASPGVT